MGLVLKSHKVPTEVPGVDFQLEKEQLGEACLRPHPVTEDCVSSSETRCKNFLSSQHLGRRQTCPGRLLAHTCLPRRLKGPANRSIGGGQKETQQATVIREPWALAVCTGKTREVGKNRTTSITAFVAFHQRVGRIKKNNRQEWKWQPGTIYHICCLHSYFFSPPPLPPRPKD